MYDKSKDQSNNSYSQNASFVINNWKIKWLRSEILITKFHQTKPYENIWIKNGPGPLGHGWKIRKLSQPFFVWHFDSPFVYSNILESFSKDNCYDDEIDAPNIHGFDEFVNVEA